MGKHTIVSWQKAKNNPLRTYPREEDRLVEFRQTAGSFAISTHCPASPSTHSRRHALRGRRHGLHIGQELGTTRARSWLSSWASFSETQIRYSVIPSSLLEYQVFLWIRPMLARKSQRPQPTGLTRTRSWLGWTNVSTIYVPPVFTGFSRELFFSSFHTNFLEKTFSRENSCQFFFSISHEFSRIL